MPTRLELDKTGAVITYEEYYPFGSTSYQAGRSVAEVSLKRYRYSGKERDEETGFCYFGARYYAPWVGRWMSPDPIGLKAGPNLYAYCKNNPITRRDPEGTQDNTTTGVGITIDTSGGVKLGPFTVKSPGPPTSDDIHFTALSPVRRVEFGLHVDEIIAVKGNKAGGVAGSPSDVANKQFLDPRTNTQTKSNFVSNTPSNPRPSVSAATSPQEAGNRLLTAPFSEVDEMHPIAADATANTPVGLRTNSVLRAGMKADPAIRNALSSAGINPDTLKAENPSGVSQFPKTGTVNLSPRDADVNAATGQVVPGPNTSAAIERRAARLSPSGSPSSGGGIGSTLARTFIPGFAEAELVGVFAHPFVVGTLGITSGALPGVAEAISAAPTTFAFSVTLPAVGGALVGNAVESAVQSAGGSRATSIGAAVLASAGTGALIGTLIPVPGVSTAAGALIGAAIGLIGYGVSKLF